MKIVRLGTASEKTESVESARRGQAPKELKQKRKRREKKKIREQSKNLATGMKARMMKTKSIVEKRKEEGKKRGSQAAARCDHFSRTQRS